MRRSPAPLAVVILVASAANCTRSEPPAPPLAAGATARWCAEVPRPANTAFARVTLPTDWFEIYRVDEGTFAFVEANQFQETISYLIVGSERALLFDTGLGMAPIRPLVEQLTALPVEVLNSHTHYDHVGGNAEFERILALDTPYTTANQAGFPHPELAGEVAPDAFCHGPPAGLDTAGFHTRAWRPFRPVADGDTIALGGRTLEVIHVPGHTPDAVALLDRARGFLWTGDSYYDATIWLYVPETDLDGYDRSMSRLVALAPNLRRLLPAHNTIAADPAHLGLALDAIRQVREGKVTGVDQSDERRVFRFGAFSILTSVPLLEGKAGDRTRGGSGLTTWR